MSKQRGKQGGSGSKLFLGGFIGLVIGVLIAFGVVLYLNKTPLPFQEKAGRPDHGEVDKTQGAAPLPGKPGDKPTERPRFEFYKILPGTQDATPAPADNATSTPPSGGEATTSQPPVVADVFYLQVGAFQKATDADNLKAKLALMGVEAKVQDVEVADKGTLHRVRTGPYATPTEMNQARTLMSQNGVQATVIKLKEDGSQTAEVKPKQ